MNILIVSAWCPFPADNGSRLRAYNIIKHLAAQGHQLTLIALGQDDSDPFSAELGLAPFCAGGARIFPSRFFQKGTLKAWLGFFSPKPRMLLDTWQPDAAREIRAQCRSKKHDIVLALQLGIAHYIPADTPIPCVLDEVEVSTYVQPWESAHFGPAKWRMGLMVAKFRRHVRSLAPRFAHWTTVSYDEQQAIVNLVGQNTDLALSVVPNGVDLAYNGYEPGAPYDPDTLIYNGALSFYANREAVEWFAQDILPRVQAQRSKARLLVTGRTDSVRPEDSLRQNPSVCLTGYLADMRPTLHGVAACVVPLRQGGGTRLKILEAMALGTPVVTTSRGAEGLEATPGRELLIADTPADFASATLRLMTEPGLRRQIAVQARVLVEERYGWAALCSALEQTLSSLTAAEINKTQEPSCR